MTTTAPALPAIFASYAEWRRHLDSGVALMTGLLDDSLSEGDDESAEELAAAIDRSCATLDALNAAGL